MKGNKLFSVHINGIRGKDKQTRPNGPNPLLFVGVTYSKDGKTGTLWEKVGTEWVKYTEIGGSADFDAGGVADRFRGNGYNLANFYKEYDWVADDGYDNFADWTG